MQRITNVDELRIDTETLPACLLPNIRFLERAAPDSVVIRFARDITNEEVEAVGKVWTAAQRHQVGDWRPALSRLHEALLDADSLVKTAARELASEAIRQALDALRELRTAAWSKP